VSSTALLCDRGTDCTVPAASGFPAVQVKGCVNTVLILCDGVPAAHHIRSYARGKFFYDR
jgi:hypothetical protein